MSDNGFTKKGNWETILLTNINIKIVSEMSTNIIWWHINKIDNQVEFILRIKVWFISPFL